MNKRGQQKAGGYTILIVIAVILIIGYLLYAFSSPEKPTTNAQIKSVFSSDGGTTFSVFIDKLPEDVSKVTVVSFAKYVFGMHSGVLKNLEVASGEVKDLSIRGAIIIISTWLIFFLFFSDMAILIAFPHNKMNGWLVGIAVTLIFANFGLYYYILIYLMGIFAFAAGISVILALFSIIILGVGAHYGATWVIGPMAEKRKIWAIQSGATKAAEGMRALKKVGEAAEN